VRFNEIKLSELDLNPFTKIEEWALLTVGDKQQFNMMTITGLMMGQLWIKKTLEVYVHPDRYSYPIMNKSDYFTVSFFPEPRCKALEIAGRLHGNQVDKTKVRLISYSFVARSIILTSRNRCSIPKTSSADTIVTAPCITASSSERSKRY
jgi:hypothetical protein